MQFDIAASIVSDHLRDAFVRQRRNLMVASALLIIAQLYAVTVPKLNLLGNEFDLHKQFPVAVALWILASYWMVRYVQVLHDLGELGFKQAHKARLDQLLPKIALRAYIERDPEAFDIEADLRPYAKYHVAHCERIAVSPRGGYDVAITIAWTARAGSRFIEGGRQEPTGIYVEPGRLRFAKWCALGYVVVRTSLVTEYVLPPFLFAAALVQFLLTRL